MGASWLFKKKQPYYLIAFRILLALLWTQYTVMIFARAIVQRLPFFNVFADYIVPVAIILALFLSIPWFIKNIRGVDVLFYLGLVVLVIFTMVVFKNNAEIISEQWWRILISSGAFYFVGLAYSHKNCSRDIFWCSLASVVAVFVYQLFKIRSGVVLEEDNMYVAYNLLPSAIYLMYYASIKLRKKYWIIAIVSALTMFVYGTRGPILCIIVYVAVYLIHRFSKTTSKRKFALILIALLALAIILIYDDLFIKLASVISNVFERFGFSTRIFDFYVSGDVAVSKGRDYLTNQVLEAIGRNPFIGYGFTGDQYLLGVYCHNLVYEMWCHFGVILGSLILLALAGLTIVALIKSRSNKKIFFFVVMLISMVYVKLMLSNSYSLEPYFYFMIGVFVAVNRKFIKRRPQKNDGGEYNESL
ncbi:MAG: hypothetical protein E7530_04200 [Ruminococcaceae bacterium]|nr:hypothetical protein [Oscillospiraceae bacterium]